MEAKRIYGGLNIEFEGKNFINFAILDKACDECLGKKGGCKGCEEVEKPWNEYYQFLLYDFDGNERIFYEKDPKKAVRQLIRLLQRMIDTKEENAKCLMEK